MKTLFLSPAAAQLLVVILEFHAKSLKRALRRRFWWSKKARSKDVFYEQELVLLQELIEQLMKE